MARRPRKVYTGARPWFLKINWALVIGALLTGFVLWIAVVGPEVAPYDPTATKMIFQNEQDEWFVPPIAAFTLDDHPLGTDRFGRDLYSQLMYAVRPTLILVTIVALTRLILGLVIGLLAGWSRNTTAQALDSLINSALTIPAIIVSLAAIAAIGVDYGVWAFVIGLSITGWADTAQMVREQTRLIRGQVYIEASQALGASTLQVMKQHILRHIMPLAWMLFSFEISGSLMATAGLGFLGYYIGGEAFITTTDTAAARVATTFELGQMLASTAEISLEPWGMVSAGSMVFIAVLAFNLLGQGLRQRLMIGELHNRSALSKLLNRFSWWLNNLLSPITYRITNWRFFWPLTSTATILALGFLGFRWQTNLALSEKIQENQYTLTAPGGHYWASTYHDSHGTRWTPENGPQMPTLLWRFEVPDGLTGGPAVAADGTLYLASSSGLLYALSPDNNLLWQTETGITPYESPGLDAVGNIFIVGEKGSLTKVTPDGQIAWQYLQDINVTASSGPVADQQGNIYFTMGGVMQAITPQGDFRWRTIAAYFPINRPPLLSPNEDLILLEDVVMLADTGEIIDVENILLAGIHDDGTLPSPLHIVDASGKMITYLGTSAVEWAYTNDEVVILRRASWPAGNFGLGFVRTVGSTPNGTFWAFSTSFSFTNPSFQWFGMDGDVMGAVRWTHRPGTLIGVDRELNYYVCGPLTGILECRVYHEGASETTWNFSLEQRGTVNGGAIVPGRLYVTTTEGALYALGESE